MGFLDNKIVITYGDDPQRMTKEILEAVHLADQIPKGALIGLKPNLVVAKPAETGATTHPEMLAGAIEYLQEHGHKNILILEGSWVGDSTKRAFKVCGYEDVSRKYGVPLFDTKGDQVVIKSYNGLSMEVCKKALEVDFLINMPMLKGHCQTVVTGALKNLKGCISDREKRHFHALGLHKPIAYLNKVLHPQFILADGICGDLDFEEGGNPVQMNRIFVGTDPVLIDSYIASSMGYEPKEIDYIRIAEQIGVGSSDIAHAEIVELNRDTTIARPTSSRKVQRLAKFAAPKEACSACYANLIQALARLDDEGLLSAFSRNPVCIGQGYKGESGEVGVGICTNCMKHSLAGCPPKTPEILAFLRERAGGR